ncbi:DUF421 domain-containing protein [Fictibacillus iocasae]|uniref:DUF421 domain-containing protein n=1 Tax=Fictibacillus iocasae TaxID=2715437 RepID=A0ABW2NTI3_9BACL
MDFFHAQETLSSAEWILRAIIAFFFMVMVAKALGQRAISQLRLLDFVIALVIGNIIAHPLSDEHLGMKGSLLTTSVLVILYLCGIYSILKWPAVRRLVTPSPVTLVKNGQILHQGLKKARISIDILLEELRENKAPDVKKVALALWEADGKVSVFLDPQYEPLTPLHMQLKTEHFELPQTVIKEGKLNEHILQQAAKDVQWLELQLQQQYKTGIKHVLLATIDSQHKLTVFLYQK